jgi:hypothetical protein
MSTLAPMLVRIRWFLFGVVVALGGGVMVVGRLVRLRRRLTPANLARACADTAARWLERAAETVAGGEVTS